ncbi:MATH and LRR domain-containing protein PFE0570w-like [Cotesia glomerata]|uniref:MATH and LRR domain-containing protein PFE0570w-like n=1 Tax=Cotesia glomerata TaxID=32391 RepID=UPI001D03122A|nr:MATH and LRR domain-containing protein PFE0570w-like [Cotesia glomerata]
MSFSKSEVVFSFRRKNKINDQSDKETEPSPISETGQNSIVKIRRSSTPEARRSRTPEARRSPTPEGRRSSTPEATPRHVEVNVVINPINKKFQNGEPKKPFSQRKYENDDIILDLSSIQPKPSSHEQMNPPIFTPEGSKNNKNKSSEKVTTVNKNMFVEPLEDEIVNMSDNDEPVFEKVQESTSKFDSRKNDTDKENAKTTRNSKKDLNNDSISPEKTMVNKFKTVDQKRKTVVVAGYTMDKNYYNKAGSSKNVASRLSSIMSGFWSDEEASKYCLKARSDKPHLQEIGDAELMPIKNIFNAINEAIPLKIMNKKKNNGVKLDDEIRNCASSNFKARRKKLKSVIPTPANTPQSTNLSVEFKDISQIDNEIARLEKLKDDLNKNKKENENVSLQQLRAMEESLKMRELELNRKEKFIKQREEELNNPERE